MRFLVMGFFLFFCAISSNAQLTNIPHTTKELPTTEPIATDSIYDTSYVSSDDGIPWNREHFPRERLLRQTSLDPALSVGFSYSASFITGSLGTFAQQSYLTHWAYEFSPNLHLFGEIGLWMPLYSNPNFIIAKEDVKQGKVEPIFPTIGLEYNFSNNSHIRLGIYNEEDVLKAYGSTYRRDKSWRNSNFYP